MRITLYRTMCMQTAAAFSRQITLKRINSYMMHVSNGSAMVDSNLKPIVVIYSWLMAKEKHFTRLYEYYLSRDFEVLKIRVQPIMILGPQRSKPVTSTILKYLSCEENQKRPLLIHGFSGGGYMYADVVATILAQPQQFGVFKNRILGHVSDSALELDSATRGVSASVSNIKFMQKAVKKALDTYIEKYPHKVSHIRKNNEIYLENPLRIPTLYIHSRGDNIAKEERYKLTKLVPKHNAMGVPSFYHEFDTPHVGHFRKYPEKYAELLDNFIAYIDIKRTN